MNFTVLQQRWITSAPISGNLHNSFFKSLFPVVDAIKYRSPRIGPVNERVMYRLCSAAGESNKPGSQTSSNGLQVTVESAMGFVERDWLYQRAASTVSADFPFRETTNNEKFSVSGKNELGKVHASEAETANALRPVR